MPRHLAPASVALDVTRRRGASRVRVNDQPILRA